MSNDATVATAEIQDLTPLGKEVRPVQQQYAANFLKILLPSVRVALGSLACVGILENGLRREG
jgi:hypothetical protein